MFGARNLRTQVDDGSFYLILFLTTLPLYLNTIVDKEKFKLFFTLAVKISSLLLGLICSLQYFGLLPVSNNLMIYKYFGGVALFRSTGLFPNSTTVGIYFLVAVPILIKVFILEKNIRFLTLASLFISYCGLVSTFGRTSLALVFLLTIYICLNHIFLKLGIRKTLISVTAFLVPVIFFMTLSENGNFLVKRFEKSLDFKNANSQRVAEIEFGLRMLNDLHWGGGAIEVSNYANNKIKAIKESGGNWEFDEWRGIHFFPLHTLILWGWPYLLFLCCVVLLPWLYWKKSNGHSLILVVALAYFLYSFTDSFIYTETAIFMVLGLYFIPDLTTSDKEEKKILFGKLALLSVSVLMALSLPVARIQIVKLVKINRLFLDNPSSSGIRIYVNDREYLLPSNHYRVYYTNNDSVKIKNSQQEIYHFSKLKYENNRSYIINFAERGDYQLLKYFRSSDSGIINKETITLKSQLEMSKLFELPSWFNNPPRKLYAELEEDLAVGTLNKKGDFENDTYRFWREGAVPKNLIDCWEPFWGASLGDYNFSTCTYGADYSAYNFGPIKKQLSFIKLILRKLFNG